MAARTLVVAAEMVVQSVTWGGTAATWDGTAVTWQVPRVLVVDTEDRTLAVPAESRTLTLT